MFNKGNIYNRKSLEEASSKKEEENVYLEQIFVFINKSTVIVNKC